MGDDNIDVGGTGEIGDNDPEYNPEGGDVDPGGTGEIGDNDPEYDPEDGEIDVGGAGYYDDGLIILDNPKSNKIKDITIHSISFGEAGRDKSVPSVNHLNTWRDWHMVPTSRPSVNPPKTRTRHVTVPGRDGTLDYTQAMGGIYYENRTGTWEFAVYHEVNESLGMSWADVYSDILTNLHGQELQVFLEDEPEYFYTGRVMVKEWKSDKWFSTVILEYDLDPYKWSVDRYDALGLHDKVTNEYNWKRYAVWFEFPVPIISVFTKKPVNRFGAYIKFDNRDIEIDKVAFLVLTDEFPVCTIKAGYTGNTSSQVTYIPFVSYNDSIKADGYSRPVKLGTDTFTLMDNTYYYTQNKFSVWLKTNQRVRLREYTIGRGSNSFDIFENDEDSFIDFLMN